MAGLFREFDIEWDGKTYSIEPNMRMLRKIELQGISITSMIIDASQGRPQHSYMALFIATVLRLAGATVSEEDEEVFMRELMIGGEDVYAMYLQMATALLPMNEADEKKPKPPVKD